MPSSIIRKSGSDPAAKADGKSTGMTIDPGPYEAEIISHVVGTRMGEMMVYIPDFGGIKNNPKDQIRVSYCSPFYGKTYGTDQQESDASSPEAQWTTGQSYGFWMVPPDIGNKVLVVFAAGSRDRGYWIGCLYDSASHHMVPALGRNVGGGIDTGKTLKPTPEDVLSPSLSGNSFVPVVEGYSGDKKAYAPDGIKSTPRYAHEYQSAVLVNQGLDRDSVRGAISSSSLREAPSNVYGFSTPGRSVTRTAQVSNAPGENASQAVIARRGGHSFVMDDGDISGSDQLIRIRTAGGHQILMNDVADKTDAGAGIIYIGSASGNQWVELSANGDINVFSTGKFSLRSKGDINFHSDSNINMHAQGAVNINGQQKVVVNSPISVDILGLKSASVKTATLSLLGTGTVSLVSGGALTSSAKGANNIMGASVDLNGASPVSVPALPKIKLNKLPDVSYDGTLWSYAEGMIDSVCTLAPAHEPWINPNLQVRPLPPKG